jgi:predicted type IV restriction endonuclease
MTDLSSTLAGVRKRIQNATKRGLNEQNTKASLIEPVLRALGWDVEDFDEVVREFRVKKRDKPVDYGLLTVRQPRLFIEAKALGANLDDRRWANQIMGYAAVAGVEWIVLTDGDEYRIYNSHAPVEVERKLFRAVRVSEGSGDVEKTLELLSKPRLEENRIEVLWRAQFVDRQVEAALESLFSSDNDMLIVNHVASQAKDLSVEEIRDSLRRCRVALDFPLLLEAPGSARSAKKRRAKAQKKAVQGRKKPKEVAGTISDLLRAGLIPPNASLVRTYKGRELRASIEADGRIRFGRKLYDSPSQAAGAARASIIGTGPGEKLPPTNGWTFWRVEGHGPKALELGDYRSRLSGGDGAEAAG